MTTAAEKAMTTEAEATAEATDAAAEKTADKAPEKRRALGRGLESLLPGGPRVVGAAPSAQPVSIVLPELHGQAQPARPSETLLQLPLDVIDRNPYQTRHVTHENENEDRGGGTLDELAESIRANGVIQPITVRQGKEGRYTLITGERRWEASKMAGKQTVSAIVKQVSDQQAAEMTVIENLQRQDLNCMDQCRAFVMLSQKFELTQDEIGQRVGLSRETVSNYMRLVRLPANVQQYLRSGTLDFSHARLLLILRDQSKVGTVAETAVKKHLSVEQLEDIVFAINLPLQKPQEPPKGRARWVDPNVRAAQHDLQRILGVKVKIRDRRGKGKIVIEYASLEDFDRVLGMLKGKST